MAILENYIHLLQKLLCKNETAHLSPITGTDMYYTDGLACHYMNRLSIIDGKKVLYSAYVSPSDFVSCDFIKTPETRGYETILQTWISEMSTGANQTQTKDPSLK
jgi:hypothetical protein